MSIFPINVSFSEINSLEEPIYLDYSTFFGGTSDDDAYKIISDEENNFYITGSTKSEDLPILNGIYDIIKSTNYRSAFVAKFSEDGSLVYSTYLTGSKHDTGTDIAVDKNGNLLVVGITKSDDYPITNNAVNKSFSGPGTFLGDWSCCGDGF